MPPSNTPLSADELAHAHQAALNAAHAAGEILATSHARLARVNLSDAHDIKLQADIESEKLIRDLLARELPFPVIGEELGGDRDLPSSATPFWVIDPLDGTFNYHRQAPLACVSIGLFAGEQPLMGVIHDFYRAETWSTRGNGSLLLNGFPHRPNWAATPAEASIHTGFPSARDYSDEALRAFMHKVQSYKKIRAIGTAAIALAWVAAGRFDAYYEETIRIWDFAAGLALVEAAGGVFTLERCKNGPPFAYNVWAARHRDLIVTN